MLDSVGCLYWDFSVLIEEGYHWFMVCLEYNVMTIQVGVEQSTIHFHVLSSAYV